MRNSYSPPADPRDEAIRRLQDELYMARAALISLMTEEQQRLLKSYYSCETRTDGYRWESDAADKLIEGATLLSREEGSYHGPRAYCPLCRDGTSSPYESGFSVPEGLRRHLIGWGGRHNQCIVFSAASKLAHDHWNDKFREAELRERAEHTARQRERTATETLFLIDPLAEPVLADVSLGYSASARSEQELVWAESRLEQLGLKKSEQGKVRSYVDEREGYAVYADPRQLGEISFVMYRLPLPKKRPRLMNAFGLSQRFRISDSWKNDLPGKYEKRVAEALAALEPRTKRPNAAG